MRVVITGASGQLGRVFATEFGAETFLLSKQELNILDSGRVMSTLEKLRPDVLINCAAYTDVDGAEQELEHCFSVNAEAVSILAKACRTFTCKLVQISSDYVFDGTLPCGQTYLESDRTRPVSAYGRSKLQGEKAAQESPDSLVVRTCGLYSVSSRNSFAWTILRLAHTHRTLRVVSDQWCTPTFAPDLAKAVAFLIQRDASGIYHVTNAGHVSWHQFAEYVLTQAGLNDVDLVGITSEEYGATAERPANSVLNTSKYERLGGPVIRHWRDAVAEWGICCKIK